MSLALERSAAHAALRGKRGLEYSLTIAETCGSEKPNMKCYLSETKLGRESEKLLTTEIDAREGKPKREGGGDEKNELCEGTRHPFHRLQSAGNRRGGNRRTKEYSRWLSSSNSNRPATNYLLFRPKNTAQK